MSKRDYPLRKIVREYSKMTYKSIYGELWENYELLECGHEIRTPRDFIGETNAMKRRCKHCFEDNNVKDVPSLL